MLQIRVAKIVLGAFLAAVAGPAARLLAGSRSSKLVSYAVTDELGGRPGPWRAMRGGLAYLGMPSLLALGGVILLVLWRRSPRTAIVFGGVVLGANLTVQALKRQMWLDGANVNPLSGHVAVAAAIGLGILAVAAVRPAVVRGLVILMAGVAVGVIFTSWHTVPQVINTLGVVAGWAVAATAFTTTAPPRESPSRRGLAAAAVLVLGLAVILVLTQVFAPPLASRPWGAVMIAGTVVVAVTLLASAVVLAAARAGQRASNQEMPPRATLSYPEDHEWTPPGFGRPK